MTVPVAYKPTSAFGGIEVMKVKDKVTWRYSGEKRLHESTLYYSATLGPYFKINGKREYLAEYMRTYGFKVN